MYGELNSQRSTNDGLKKCSLYQIFQAQREEIMKHKWIESEKAGHDIGFEQALTDWELKHHTAWLKEQGVVAWRQAKQK